MLVGKVFSRLAIQLNVAEFSDLVHFLPLTILNNIIEAEKAYKKGRSKEFDYYVTTGKILVDMLFAIVESYWNDNIDLSGFNGDCLTAIASVFLSWEEMLEKSGVPIKEKWSRYNKILIKEERT